MKSKSRQYLEKRHSVYRLADNPAIDVQWFSPSGTFSGFYSYNSYRMKENHLLTRQVWQSLFTETTSHS